MNCGTVNKIDSSGNMILYAVLAKYIFAGIFISLFYYYFDLSFINLIIGSPIILFGMYIAYTGVIYFLSEDHQ